MRTAATIFIERLQNTLQRYGIDPCYIEIEVTESVIVEKLDSLKAVSYQTWQTRLPHRHR